MHQASSHSDSIERVLFYSLCGVFFLLPLGTSLTLVSSAVVLSVWMFSGKAFRDRNRWLGRSWALPVFAFIALHWMGLLYTDDVSLGFRYAKKTYYWLMAFAVASASFQRRDGETLIKFFIAGLLAMSAVSLSQWAGLLPVTRAVTSIFTHHIANSLLLVAGMMILSLKFREVGDTKRRAFILVAMALFLAVLSIGTSRAGYLAFFIMSPLIVYNLFGGRHMIKIAVSIFLIVAAVLLSPTVQMRISQTVESIERYDQGDAISSVGVRFVMWEGAVNIIREDPLLGVGTGGYMKAMREHNDKVPQDFDHPHSTYFYMATSFGIVGLACLIWLLYIPLKRGWANRKGIVGFSIFSYTAVLAIGSLTNTQIMSPESGIFFALLVGLQEHLDAGRLTGRAEANQRVTS